MGILNEWKATDDSGKFIPHAIISNGGNPVSASNPLPTTATVTVDTMSLTAELSEASSHDYYVTTTNLGDGTDTIGFDAVAGLALANIVKAENKTQGCVYVTAGATVTTTALELDMTKQPTGTPVPGATDEFEIVYRAESRFDKIDNVLSVTNLNAVTTATAGASVTTGAYRNKTVYVNVSVNTGAVTVNIEISPDGTNWYNYDSKIYTGVTALDSWSVDGHFPYMRTTTTTQSNSTVTTVIQGRGL